jgi:hypothetical protein
LAVKLTRRFLQKRPAMGEDPYLGTLRYGNAAMRYWLADDGTVTIEKYRRGEWILEGIYGGDEA